MPVEKLAGSNSLVDVMDRVLDQGLRWDEATASALLHAPWTAARVVVTFVEVRTDDTSHGTPPRPSPGV